MVISLIPIIEYFSLQQAPPNIIAISYEFERYIQAPLSQLTFSNRYFLKAINSCPGRTTPVLMSHAR